MDRRLPASRWLLGRCWWDGCGAWRAWDPLSYQVLNLGENPLWSGPITGPGSQGPWLLGAPRGALRFQGYSTCFRPDVFFSQSHRLECEVSWCPGLTNLSPHAWQSCVGGWTPVGSGWVSVSKGPLGDPWGAGPPLGIRRVPLGSPKRSLGSPRGLWGPQQAAGGARTNGAQGVPRGPIHPRAFPLFPL